MKKIAAFVLLSFALITLVFIAISVKKTSQDKAVTKTLEKKSQFFVYYLFGNVRCVTCKQMESMTDEAMQLYFSEELKKQTISFQKKNFEAPGEDFSTKYNIVATSVLLVEENPGKEPRWKNLSEIWYLTDSKEKFQNYLKEEIALFLKPLEPGIKSPEPKKNSFSTFWIALFSALGLGLLTSVSPCPLATNIAAISFLGKNVKSSTYVLISGLFYSLGRMASYVGIGALIIFGLLSAPGLSRFLSQYINSILSVLLIVSGVLLLEWLELSWGTIFSAEKWQKRAEKSGFMTSFLLGGVFALAFCPTSAALFFGALIPLSLKAQSSIAMPLIYGFGTAIPVIIFSIVVALSFQAVGKIFNQISKIELWLRRITGVLFIVIGVYLALVYVYGV